MLLASASTHPIGLTPYWPQHFMKEMAQKKMPTLSKAKTKTKPELKAEYKKLKRAGKNEEARKLLTSISQKG